MTNRNMANSRFTLRSIVKTLVKAFVWFCAITLIMVLPLRWINPLSTSFIIRDIIKTGEAVHAEWRPLEEIGINAPMSVIASEDQKFNQHYGFDVTALANAIEARMKGEDSGGASTITQQLAKNLWLWPNKSFLRKGLEAWYAGWLELLLPKKRILELYMNIAEFGDRNYGIEAASQHYFGIAAKELSPDNAALLAASLPNPQVFNVAQPSNAMRNRARWIVQQVRQLGGAQYLNAL